MTPDQFVGRLRKSGVPAVCLFLGMEAFERRRCREAALAAHLESEERERGLTRYDASETTLSEIVDDARAMSLFASKRFILVTSAEASLPRTLRSASTSAPAMDDDDDSPAIATPADCLTAYVKDPTPGVVVLWEATRFDLEGEDKKKSDRVRKFYASIPDVVEFRRYSPDDARVELRTMAERLKLRIEPSAAAMLVESLGADMARIATEIEKLALYTGDSGTVTEDDVVALVPDARSSTVFALVNALGRGDRARALASLDILCRENEYLPLALAFLSTQFRQALAARNANLRTPQQIQSYFSKSGIPVWGTRAEQIAQTAQKFSVEQLQTGLKLIFQADRDLRSARPDDRTVMEEFVVSLTA